MKYYYCDSTKKLIPLDIIINSSTLPISVKKLSEKISEYIDIVESPPSTDGTPAFYTSLPSNSISPISPPLRSSEPLRGPLSVTGGPENREKIIICFFKLDKYRRGSVYVGIQISFNHKAGYNLNPYSDPYKKCNISIKAYCTDTIHHSAISFGTTPSKQHCEKAINFLKINKNILHEYIYKTFYYFCEND